MVSQVWTFTFVTCKWSCNSRNSKRSDKYPVPNWQINCKYSSFDWFNQIDGQCRVKGSHLWRKISNISLIRSVFLPRSTDILQTSLYGITVVPVEALPVCIKCLLNVRQSKPPVSPLYSEPLQIVGRKLSGDQIIRIQYTAVFDDDTTCQRMRTNHRHWPPVLKSSCKRSPLLDLHVNVYGVVTVETEHGRRPKGWKMTQ